MSPLLLVLLAVNSNAQQQFYTNTRMFLDGIMTGFEGSGYLFPVSTCLNSDQQSVFFDEAATLGVFTTLIKPQMISRVFGLIWTDIQDVVLNGCDLVKIQTAVSEKLQNTGFAQWSFELFLKSVLLDRLFLEGLAELNQGNYNQAGMKMGQSVYYLIRTF